MNRKVSIIIPTFNRAHLIGETLDSIFAQTYGNWECIIIDDGSTDNTEEVVEKYIKSDERFHFYRRPKNRPKGANACRNYGFELSEGEFINWFDSDDLMNSDKLETQLKIFNEADYNFVTCQSKIYNRLKNQDLGLRSENLFSNNIIDDFINFKTFWLLPAPLWKRSFLDQNKLFFDERLHQAQDYDFHIRVLENSHNYGYTNKPLVTICVHSNNMSKSRIDTSNKIYSNVMVNYRIIQSKNSEISTETRQLKFIDLFKMHKASLRINNKILSVRTYILIVKAMNRIDSKPIRKFKFISRTTLVTLFFVFFGKGERLLKYNF